MKLEQIKSKINGKIAIIGYGREGQSTLRFLQKLGAIDITIHDQKNIENKDEKIKYIEGEGYLSFDKLKNYDLIIKSPGISPFLNNFSGLEDKITTQTDIFINNFNGKIIGITGTKGKSTTSTVTTLTLQNAGYKSVLVGNIGTPVLDEIDILGDNIYDYVIYEMSSYMLEGIKPELYVGYINNIYDCHLDWHMGKANYTNAKLNTIKYSKNKIVNIEAKDFILNTESFKHPKTGNYILSNLNSIIYFGEGSNIVYKDNFFFLNGEKIFEDKNILLEGPHNRNNILGIIGILKAISTNEDNFKDLIKSLQNILSSFSGLPYRLENIGTYKGITFINDAMATTPDSSIAAISTFGEKIGTLFLGGQDSGFNFTKLRKIIEQYKIKNLVLLPENSEKIFPETINNNYETEFILDLGDYKPNILKTESLEKGISFAYNNSNTGEIILLSTGSPFILINGKWNPYTTKGNLFNEYVKKFS